MRRNILITITLIGIQVLFGFSPTSCTYNVSTNILSIQFNEPVNTNNVLLGLLSISDGQTTLSFTGGDILNPDELANNVDINMVYGTIVESRGDFHYWGRTNLQAIAIEEMDLNNLSLNITAGTFINGLNQPNAISESIDIIVTDIDDSVPQITNVEYDAGQNLLHFNFDRLVQFDQIAEDRSCSGGTGNCPGNGALDGNPSEDTNGNGVLEMESNINPFKIHFYSGENELTLEGFRSVVQTSDSDVISLYPTISDAKKLELNIIESATTDIFAVITKGAFVDLDYNPNQTDTLALDIQVDALPLEITDATYDLGLNEFRFYFANSRNVEIFDPFPVYSKIKIISGENETNLNGVKQKSFSGNTLILTELLFSDQEVVEQLILNTPENNTIFVELDAYAVYDVNGNGNIPGTMPLTILEDTNNPVLTASSYDASTNRIILDWSPATVTYYETTRLFETVENMSISGITVSNLTTGEVLILQNANVSRDGTKHLTYLEVSEENSGWFELSSTAGDQLSISIEPYVFYSSGNTNNNGNLAEEAIMTYIADSQGPGIESIKIDFEAKQLLIGLDKNVQTDYSSFDSVTLIINDSEIEITGLNLVNSELTSNSLIYDIADAQFNDILTAMPMNEVVNVSINVPEGVFNTVDNVPGLGCQDLNNNGECDLLAEPFDDYGIDNIMNANEEGYPGSCDPAGGCSDPVFLTESECEAYVCSDPQFTNMNDCLEPGVCSRPFWGDTREECEGHVPPGIWYSDNTWAPSGEWTDFATESLCNNGGATWTPNLDPSGDNYDPITNPTGTENNGLYDEGENYTELYVNGMWDPYEPTTKRLSYGKTMWNQSHRAFPDPAAQMFFVLPYQNSEVEIYVEESVWNGRCHDGDINSGSGCTDSNMEYINGRCVFLDIASEEECLSIPGIGDWEATWTRVTQEDVVDVADFFLSHKDELITMYGSPGEKIPIVLYDISDEFGKGANDTNSSLFTHGYFSIDESSGVGQNAGDILYLDVFPQAVYNGVSDIPDESTMYNALVHEFTKMLITINEPEEEVWLKEGLAYFEQKRLLGETKFFGNGTNPGSPAANQLTYISFSKKNRGDHHNVYLFLNYLFEKYSGDTGWEIINEIATNGFQGIEAIDQALIAMDPENPNTKEVFIDYATACFLDLHHELGEYGGKYNMDNVDLYGAPSSKNAAALKFDDNRPPPYSIREIPPWSFGFYLIEGFSVSLLDNSVSFKSPLLFPYDDLAFDGYNGIDFRMNKIMLKNGFTELMNPMYEVVGFDIDPETGKGSLPVTTNSISGQDFEFKSVSGSCEDNVSQTEEECCINNNGTWSGGVCSDATLGWVWSGNMNLVLIVAKVDDTQPPPSYDFVVTNITTPQDFSDFYVLQNPGVHNFLDLYVASQRPIFDEYGVEGPRIQVASEFDTTYILLNPISSPNSDLVMYYSPFILGEWDNYTLTYSGMDQSGNQVETDVVQVSTNYSTTTMGRIINSSDHEIGLTIYDTNIESEQFVYIENSDLLKQDNFLFSVEGVLPTSNCSYFGPEGYSLSKPAKISFKLSGENPGNMKIYHHTSDGWINIGGTVENGNIRAYSDELGYFLLASGDHPQDQSVLAIPDHYTLDQNYPNPFNPVTNIGFSIPGDEYVLLDIYNINGQHIRTLCHGFYSAGEYSLRWDGLNETGTVAPTGVYFARLSTDNYSQTIKMVLMK